MAGLDHAISGLGAGGGIVVALAMALLLGLRHATDPDHLTAVSTLVMSGQERGPGAAARLGLAWGLGHACALFAVGVPVVLFGARLPGWTQHALELAVGVVIAVLALRLLRRARRGYFHVQVHRRAHELGRSPLASFGIGIVHGAGGSAGVGVLLVAALSDPALAVAALAVLALGTAISMTAVSGAFGYALTRGPLLARFGAAAPALGALSLAFGVWYVAAALAVV